MCEQSQLTRIPDSRLITDSIPFQEVDSLKAERDRALQEVRVFALCLVYLCVLVTDSSRGVVRSKPRPLLF